MVTKYRSNLSLGSVHGAFLLFLQSRENGEVLSWREELRECHDDTVDYLASMELSPEVDDRIAAEVARLTILNPIEALLDLRSPLEFFPCEEMRRLRESIAESDDAYLLDQTFCRQGRARELEDMLCSWIARTSSLRI